MANGIVTPKIIGVSAFIGGGKSAFSQYLQREYRYVPLSFAYTLKKAVSEIFGWDFNLLQGKTEESRKWRETIDTWWANRLNIPNLTPRWVLQQWGTEVGRYAFHKDIWIASLERQILNTKSNIIIDDCRFPNEFGTIRRLGGKLAHVLRGPKPIWYDCALNDLIKHNGEMAVKYPNVHISEWGWLLQDFDYIIQNEGTLKDFHSKIDITIFQK